MKKPALKLISTGLILIFILSACGTTEPLTEAPNAHTAKLEVEIKKKDLKLMELETKIEELKDIIKELESNEDKRRTTLEPTGEILSVSEAQDLLIDWYEWNKVYYLPDMDKQDEEAYLYGFLVDYSDGEVEWSNENYCFSWVNSSTEMISFEEAGYSEAAGRNYYANIPDSIFPIPMRDSVVIPYDWFSPPDYVWGVAYSYEDESVMESYQAQLEEVGFVDLGTVQSVESLWQYDWSDDGTIFIVEMSSEGEMFSMTMYIN